MINKKYFFIKQYKSLVSHSKYQIIIYNLSRSGKVKSAAACSFIQLFSLSSAADGSLSAAVVLSGAVISGAEVGFVSAVSGSVGAVADNSDSDVTFALSVEELPCMETDFSEGSSDTELLCFLEVLCLALPIVPPDPIRTIFPEIRFLTLPQIGSISTVISLSVIICTV